MSGLIKVNIQDINQAHRYIKQSLYLTIFVIVITTLLFLLLRADPDLSDSPFASNEVLFDIALLSLIAFFIHKKSTIAVTSGAIYFIVSFAAKLMGSFGLGFQSVAGVLIWCLYVFVFYRAFFAARYLAAEAPNSSLGVQVASKKKSILIYSLIGISVMLVGAGIYTDKKGFVDVMEATTIPQGIEKDLKNQDWLKADDTLAYMYYFGFSLEDGFVYLADSSIGMLYEELIYKIEYSAITSVTLEEEGSYFSDSIFLIETAAEDSWMSFPLSTSLHQKSGRGDLAFIAELEKRIASTN